MRRNGQTVIEYLFILAAVLILVALTTNILLQSMQNTNRSIGEYVRQVRKSVLENL